MDNVQRVLKCLTEWKAAAVSHGPQRVGDHPLHGGGTKKRIRGVARDNQARSVLWLEHGGLTIFSKLTRLSTKVLLPSWVKVMSEGRREERGERVSERKRHVKRFRQQKRTSETQRGTTGWKDTQHEDSWRMEIGQGGGHRGQREGCARWGPV